MGGRDVERQIKGPPRVGRAQVGMAFVVLMRKTNIEGLIWTRLGTKLNPSKTTILIFCVRASKYCSLQSLAFDTSLGTVQGYLDHKKHPPPLGSPYD